MAESIPLADAYKNVAPPPDAKSISLEDAYKNAPAADIEPTKHTKSAFERGVIEDENKQLAAHQFTSPYYNEYKNEKHLGEATTDDSGMVTYTDKDGKTKNLDADKHVVLKNPEDGKHHVFERSEDTDYGPVKGRLMMLGQMVQRGLASTTPVTGGTAALSAAQRAIQAQKAISETTGVTVPVSRAAVQPGLLARTLSHVPGVNTTFEKAAQGTAAGLEQASTAAAEGVGAAKTASEAGSAVRGGLQNYVAPAKDNGVLAQKVGAAYDKVDSLVNQTAKMPLSNTMKVAQDLNLERLATERPDEYGAAVKEVMGAVTNPNGLTYSSLKTLRSVIGEKLGAATSEMDKTDLKRLYKGLSDDMRDLISTHGSPRATQLWERANDMHVAGIARRDTLSKILGNTNKSDEATFATMQKLASTKTMADAKTLATARKSLNPDEWSELASGIVSRLGRTGEGATSVFDPTKWAKDYAGISEAGKNIMFGGATPLRRALDNIHKLSSEWSTMRNLGREPGEMSHVALVAGGLESVREGGGLVGAVKLLSAVAGLKGVAAFLSRPATAANVAKYMQSYKLMAMTPTKGNLVALNEAVNAMAKDAAEGDREKVGDAASTAYDYAKKMTSMLPWAPK